MLYRLVWTEMAMVVASWVSTPLLTNVWACDVAANIVWVLELVVVVVFRASLAFGSFTMSSKASFATIYPSSLPKFIPLSIPSSNLFSIFASKFHNTAFLPSS